MDYTKGDWKSKRYEGCLYPSVFVEESEKGEQVIVDCFNTMFTLPENEANARLIASAPDLYEACKGFLDNAGDIELTIEQALRLEQYFKGMREAIAKAEVNL